MDLTQTWIVSKALRKNQHGHDGRVIKAYRWESVKAVTMGSVG
jgi:hypothetical protein